MQMYPQEKSTMPEVDRTEPKLLTIQYQLEKEVAELYEIKNEIQYSLLKIYDARMPTEPVKDESRPAEPNLVEHLTYSLNTLRSLRHEFNSIRQQLNDIV